jgi:hypothetical protein
MSFICFDFKSFKHEFSVKVLDRLICQQFKKKESIEEFSRVLSDLNPNKSSILSIFDQQAIWVGYALNLAITNRFPEVEKVTTKFDVTTTFLTT